MKIGTEQNKLNRKRRRRRRSSNGSRTVGRVAKQARRYMGSKRRC
jgi:hypothetical protein